MKEQQEHEDVMRTQKLEGSKKAAVLLISLGVEAASKVLKVLRDEEVEQVSVQVARMRNVSSDVVEQVLVEYRDLSMAHDYIAQGGVNYAKDILSSALGNRRAEEIMMRVEAAMEVSAFHLLQTVETTQLTNFLQKEHPQTAALILSHLNPRKSSDIIASLPNDLRSEILVRLATMGRSSPELLRDIEDVIRQQLGSVFGAELSATGGVDKVAEILNGTSRTVEKSILESIRESNHDLATDIKGLMFVFDDLVHIEARDLQRLLTEVDQKDLAMALKAASGKLKDKIMNNVSNRVGDSIQEEMELMGRVRVSDVDEAQHAIIEIAQRLEEEGELVLSRNETELV